MQLVVSIAYFTLVYVVIAKSYQLTYMSSRFFQLSHAIVIAIGAYFVYWLSIQMSLNYYLSFVFSLFLSSIIGWSIDLLVYHPLRKNKRGSVYIMIASLGVFVFLQNVISLLWGDRLLPLQSQLKGYIIILDSIYISYVQITTIVLCFLLLLILHWFSENTSMGKTIKMVSINPVTSEIVGINTENAIGWSYFLGSLFAAFTGILIASNYNIIPKMGFNWLFPAVVTMIIAGIGRIRYLVFGALLLAIVQQLSAYFLDSMWMNATAYIILIIFLYFRPFGFSGKKPKKTEV